MWGGVEYTCNRVGNRYFDQVDLSGHARRVTDYVKFAQLGIRTLRVGLLWERQARSVSWEEPDAHLQSLQQLSIRPIAGLIHHGSGPEGTNLLDPHFPQRLSAYARQVALRYPWIDAYTPVNEPNTTARFSTLYGLWFPHHQSRRSYVRALLGQLKGTVLSMRAIRQVQPAAQLIQTEDVGKISGTPELRDTCDLLNERQWLTFDLLCGRVNARHPLFAYLRAEEISEREIGWFAENPCPPNVIGLNYYVTSDRHLDHRIDSYPTDRISAEGRFVDVEAVRAQQGIAGVDSLLREAWQRYGLPVAVTEVHLGGAVPEQIRWLAEIWSAVMKVRREGVPCIAMTAWALLGSFYWNELVTCENGHYEAGAFELRDGRPVPTALTGVLAQIGAGKPPHHEALSHRGWWRHPQRVCFPLEAVIAA